MESLEIKRETDYLRNVLYILEKKIEGNTAMLKAAEEDISKNLKYAWDNLDVSAHRLGVPRHLLPGIC